MTPEATTNEKPAPVHVPWTRAQEEAIKLIVAKADATPWELGDAALAAVPMGDVPGQRTGGQKMLKLLAQRAGAEFDQLRMDRDVASAWPPPTRVGAATFGAHRAFVSKEVPAEARAALLQAVAAKAPNGKATADLVRRERAKETLGNYAARKPGERVLGLLDHARKCIASFRSEFTGHLLDKQPTEKWREQNRDKVYRRAAQLRYAAALLERVADGEDLPSSDDVRDTLDTRTW